MDENNSIREKLKVAFENNKPANVLENIEKYNNEMTISQVVRFFERQGLSFTKTMIQNYVRVGVIPPPQEKRYYIKKHLILLTLIDSLKDIYSLEEISTLFKPIMKDTKTFDDDVIDISVVYNEFQTLYKRHMDKLEQEIPKILTEASKRAKFAGIMNEQNHEVTEFITLLSLMVQTVAAKKIVKNMMDNEREKSL